jgi:hypothetical protein
MENPAVIRLSSEENFHIWQADWLTFGEYLCIVNAKCITTDTLFPLRHETLLHEAKLHNQYLIT